MPKLKLKWILLAFLALLALVLIRDRFFKKKKMKEHFKGLDHPVHLLMPINNRIISTQKKKYRAYIGSNFYPGNFDIGLKQKYVQDVNDCREKCVQTDECAGFVMSRNKEKQADNEGNGKGKYKCWLKEAGAFEPCKREKNKDFASFVDARVQDFFAAQYQDKMTDANEKKNPYFWNDREALGCSS